MEDMKIIIIKSEYLYKNICVNYSAGKVNEKKLC